MTCKHCKKEEETIKIAGKTYCTNCSNILSEEPAEPPKHKMPELVPDDVGIQSFAPTESPVDIPKETIELSKNTGLPAKSKDELGSSAILLDILSEDAKELQDGKTLEKDDALEKASEQILDTIAPAQPEPPKVAVMNDISPQISQKGGYMPGTDIKEKKKSLWDEPVSEEGFTREYDMLIILSGFVVVLVTLVVALVAFKQYL